LPHPQQVHDNNLFLIHKERSSEILDGQCCRIQPTVLTSHPSHSHLFGTLKKEIYEDTIRPVKRHCILPCVNGCRGEIPTFTGWEYLLIFKGGRRLPKRMDSIMKNIYAFNNIVVKLCEMFLCTNLLTIIFMVITVHQ